MTTLQGATLPISADTKMHALSVYEFYTIVLNKKPK